MVWIVAPLLVYLLYRLGLTRPLLFVRSKAGDYSYSDQGDWRDFFRSLVPRDELQLTVLIIFFWGCRHIPKSLLQFPYEQISYHGVTGILLAGHLVFLVGQVISAGMLVLKWDAFFPWQIAMLALILILRCAGLMAWGLQDTVWNWTADTLLVSFFLFINTASVYTFREAFYPWGTSRRMRPRGFPPRYPPHSRWAQRA